MAKNIEINVFNGSGYEALYPKTLVGNVTDAVSNSAMSNYVDPKIVDKLKFKTGSYTGNGTFRVGIQTGFQNLVFINFFDAYYEPINLLLFQYSVGRCGWLSTVNDTSKKDIPNSTYFSEGSPFSFFFYPGINYDDEEIGSFYNPNVSGTCASDSSANSKYEVFINCTVENSYFEFRYSPPGGAIGAVLSWSSPAYNRNGKTYHWLALGY